MAGTVEWRQLAKGDGALLRSCGELLQVLRQENTNTGEPIRFYRQDEPYGCFVNFSPHPIFQYFGQFW